MTATATVKERPILFSTPMVQAILEGRKTQTRRAIKPQPHAFESGNPIIYDRPLSTKIISCPYGVPGDRLWVREAWQMGCTDAGNPDGGDEVDIDYGPIPKGRAQGRLVGYAADGLDGPFRPSIHMPRWASRITLEITEVRVERLKQITEADAIAEGARRFDDIPLDPCHERDPVHADRWSMEIPITTAHCLSSARFAFGNLWEKINGVGTWDANPFVWTVSFRRITQEQHP